MEREGGGGQGRQREIREILACLACLACLPRTPVTRSHATALLTASARHAARRRRRPVNPRRAQAERPVEAASRSNPYGESSLTALTARTGPDLRVYKGPLRLVLRSSMRGLIRRPEVGAVVVIDHAEAVVRPAAGRRGRG